MLAQLKKAETTNAQLDSETGFMNTIVRTAPPNAPVVAGKPAAITESAAPEIEVAAESVPLPEPELDEVPEGGSLPPVPTDEAPPVPPDEAAPAPNVDQPFVCSVCQIERKFRSQLKQHAESKHPDQVEAIMAPYPLTT